MTPAQYAQNQGVSTRTVERWLAAGELPTASQTPDGRWHIPADAVRQRPLIPSGDVPPRQPRQGTDMSPTRRGDVVPTSAPTPAPRTLAEALDQQPALLALEDAARLLGIPESGIRKHAEELGALPWGPRGRLVVPQSAVRRLAGL